MTAPTAPRTNGVPTLPFGYVERPEVVTLREALLGTGDGDASVLGLHGAGGSGKSVIAAAVAHDPEVRRHFADGVFWVTLGAGDVIAAQADLLARLGAPQAVDSSIDGQRRLQAHLHTRRCLVIVDDVRSGSAAGAIRTGAGAGRVVLTVRDERMLHAVGARATQVAALPADVAREILARHARVPAAALPEASEAILAATGRNALTLALAGARIGRGGAAWDDVADELQRRPGTRVDDAFKALQAAGSSLDGKLAELYATLAIFPGDTEIPVATVSVYWARIFGLSRERTGDGLRALADHGLVGFDGSRLLVAGVQHEFLLLHAPGLELLHGELVHAHRRALPEAWWQLVRADGYLRGNLLHHLRGALDLPAVARVATDAAYLTMRAYLDGWRAAERDLRDAVEACPDDEALAWLLERLTPTGHLLDGLGGLPTAANTLLGRLLDAPADVATDGMARLVSERVLVPRVPLAEEPALERVLMDGAVNCAFAPDGTRMAVAGETGVSLWDGSGRRLLAQRPTDTGPGLAFAPDSTRLVVWGDEGFEVWDLARDRRPATVTGQAQLSVVVFTPDGRRVATTGHVEVLGPDGTPNRVWPAVVRLWDAASGRMEASLEGHQGSIWALEFAPDGTTMASAGVDGKVRLWDSATGELKAVLEGHAGRVGQLAYAADGTRLASGDEQGALRLWDPVSGELIAAHDDVHGAVYALAFTPDGRRLASVGTDGALRLWEPRTGELLTTLRAHAGTAWALAAASDSTVLASGGDDGVVRLWDPITGHLWATLRGHTDSVTNLAFAPAGMRLASRGNDSLRLWNAGNREADATPRDHAGTVSALAFAPGGQMLASGGWDGSLRLRDAATGRILNALEGHTGAVVSLTFTPDGTHLLSAGRDNTVRLWDLETSSVTQFLDHEDDGWAAFAVSPDGTCVASATAEGSIRLWEHTNPLLVFVVDAEDWVTQLAFSPDGARFASVRYDGAVVLWDFAAGTPVQTLEEPIAHVAFAPDGSFLASGAADGTVRVHDPFSGAARAELGRLDSGVGWLSATSDGALLAARGWSGPVRLWNPSTGQHVTDIELRSERVAALEFSPQGTRLAAAGEDGLISLWDPRTGALISELRLGLRAQTLAWSENGLAVAAGHHVVILDERARASALGDGTEHRRGTLA